jgi:hypothetical protein
MKTKWLAATLLCASALTACTPAQTHSERRKLARETVIQGYPCAKGYAWFHPGGSLDSCTVAQEVAFGEARIPAGSIIGLTPDGKPKNVRMSHDAAIRGWIFQGGGPLGAAEGSMVAFYPSGRLREGFLAGDQTIDGVPCAHGGLATTVVHGDPSVWFGEDGRLERCRLSQDFGGQKKDERFSRQAGK